MSYKVEGNPRVRELLLHFYSYPDCLGQEVRLPERPSDGPRGRLLELGGHGEERRVGPGLVHQEEGLKEGCFGTSRFLITLK